MSLEFERNTLVHFMVHTSLFLRNGVVQHTIVAAELEIIVL